MNDDPASRSAIYIACDWLPKASANAPKRTFREPARVLRVNLAETAFRAAGPLYAVCQQEAFMRGDLKSITQYREPSGDAFASVVRSFSEANSRLQALAIESVGRAVEIQSQFVGKAYDTYISEISKLGGTFFLFAQPLAANLNEKRLPIGPVGARPRIAAQSMSTERKTGPVTKRKSQSGSRRSTKAKGKAGSAHRKKG